MSFSSLLQYMIRWVDSVDSLLIVFFLWEVSMMVSNTKNVNTSISHLRMLDLDVAFQQILVGCLGQTPRSPRVNLAHDHDHDHHPHCWMPHFSGQQKTGVMTNYQPNTTQYYKGNPSKLPYICIGNDPPEIGKIS